MILRKFLNANNLFYLMNALRKKTLNCIRMMINNSTLIFNCFIYNNWINVLNLVKSANANTFDYCMVFQRVLITK